MREPRDTGLLRRSVYALGRLVLRVLFTAVRPTTYEGLDRSPPRGSGFIIASNHLTSWDPFMVGNRAPGTICFMAKSELFAGFSGFVMWVFRAFPVDRSKSDRAALRKALAILARGDIVGIFPEGTRSRDGELGDARRGTAVIAMLAKKPIVPAAIVHPDPLRWPRRSLVRYGTPIDPADFEGSKQERIEMITKALMQGIADLQAT